MADIRQETVIQKGYRTNSNVGTHVLNSYKNSLQTAKKGYNSSVLSHEMFKRLIIRETKKALEGLNRKNINANVNQMLKEEFNKYENNRRIFKNT